MANSPLSHRFPAHGTPDVHQRWFAALAALLLLGVPAVALPAPLFQQAEQGTWVPIGSAQDQLDGEAERIAVQDLPTEAVILASQELTGFPMSLEFEGTDIRDVATFFSNVTGLNVLVDPDVSGPVTLKFTDVPWDLAFDAILRSHGLGYQVQRNIVRVSSLGQLATEAEVAGAARVPVAAASPTRYGTLVLAG